MTQRLQGKLRTARQLGHYTLEEERAMSTGLDELEIELGGRATPTTVAAPKPPSRPRK